MDIWQTWSSPRRCCRAIQSCRVKGTGSCFIPSRRGLGARRAKASWVIRTEGVKLLFGGTVITIVPIVVGYFFARKLFKLSIVHSLGGLCGGMTSTPGLGALNQLIDSKIRRLLMPQPIHLP